MLLHTQLNPRSAEFATNSAAMRQQVDALHTLLAHVQQGGGAKAQERHTSRGKLLPREAYHRLLDPGSPFSNSANWRPIQCSAKIVPAAGLIAGMAASKGRMHDRRQTMPR